MRSVLVASAPHASTTVRRQGAYVRIWKPCLDKFLSVCLITVAAPVMALIALLIQVSLGSNVIFRQPRMGIHGSSFDVLKFRTMLPDRRKANVPISFPDRRCTHKSGADKEGEENEHQCGRRSRERKKSRRDIMELNTDHRSEGLIGHHLAIGLRKRTTCARLCDACLKAALHHRSHIVHGGHEVSNLSRTSECER